MTEHQLNLAKLATLSRLALDESEMQHLTSELNDIISMLDALTTVDTSGVTPLAHPLDITQPRRPDTACHQIDRSKLQETAPQTHDGLYIVPQFIEEK